MTFHSLFLPNIHAKAEAGATGPGPKVVGQQPSAGPRPNFLKEPQNTEVLKGPPAGNLPWFGVGILYHCNITPDSTSWFPDLILLRELTPPWLMGDSRFSPKSPTSADYGSCHKTFIFLKDKFWLAFLERLLLPTVGRPSSRSRRGQCLDVQFWKSLGCKRNEPMSQLEGNPLFTHSQDLRIFWSICSH